jgi:hypothetical protein
MSQAKSPFSGHAKSEIVNLVFDTDRVESRILIFDNAMSTQFPSHLSLAQPNCKFNVDANSGHAFGILLAAVGALRPSGLRRQLTSSLGPV